MNMRTPVDVGVGDMLFSSEFRIAPIQLASWARDRVLGGRDDQPGFRRQLEAPPAFGGAVPHALLLARGVAAIEDCSALRGLVVGRTSLGELRSLAPLAAGQGVCAIARVRHRSQGADGSAAVLTLLVELCAGSRTVAEFELALEIRVRVGALLPLRSPPLWAETARAA